MTRAAEGGFMPASSALITRVVAASAICLLGPLLGQAAVSLPSLISDRMVLQQDKPVRIWGKATPGEGVTVSFRGQKVTTQTRADGRWEIFLAPMKAGGPFELTVAAENTITVRDVLVGEVWVGSGQSNMVWPVQRSSNPEQEAAGANYPQIRLFQVALKVAEAPAEDVEGEWKVCTPESVKSFSAVGYAFARHLHSRLKVPMGVVQSAWGGTPAQAWTSQGALEAEPSLHRYLENWQKILAAYPAARQRYLDALKEFEQKGGERKPQPPMGPGHQHSPAGLYNAMVAPLTPFAIRGVIWYQGESNANQGEGAAYRRLFQTMILDWRRAWGQGAFPFLFVQLANFAKTGANSNWPELRAAQTAALELRKTGMAVTIDIGDPADIHPLNKRDVGERLGLAARAIAYGEQLVYSGPLYRQMTREDGRLRLWFDHTGGGLKARDGDLRGFTVAGADGAFYPAEAKVESGSIVVSSPAVKHPLAARYAWADDPNGNLINAEGLPASPFRTDAWRENRKP